MILLEGTILEKLGRMSDAIARAAMDATVRAWLCETLPRVEDAGDGAGVAASCAALTRVYSPRELARRVQVAVQRLYYCGHSDHAADYARDAAETLLDKCGNCADKSILAAAADVLLALPARLEWEIQSGAPVDHVTLLVSVDGRWLYQDVTIAADLGEEPHATVRRLSRAEHHEVDGHGVDAAYRDGTRWFRTVG